MVLCSYLIPVREDIFIPAHSYEQNGQTSNFHVISLWHYSTRDLNIEKIIFCNNPEKK